MTKLPHVVTSRNDGEEAMAYLRASIEGATKRPDLILLDWNLPRRHGREVLRDIKTDKDLCRIPVVVLTSSSDDTDVREAYELHANCFCTKPVRLDDFVDVVTAIERFWFAVAEIPRS